MMCGNSNGCSTTTGWRPRKSFSAAPNVGRAVVKTSAVCPGRSGAVAGRGTFSSKTRQPRPPARVRTKIRQRRAKTVPASGILTGRSLRRSGRLGSLAADEVDDVPHVAFGQRALHRLHLGHRRRGTVPDHRVDLAVAGPVIPLVVGQIRRLWILRRERAVAFEPEAMALPAVHVVNGAPCGYRGWSRWHGVLGGAQLRITTTLLGAGAGDEHETNENSEECSPHSRHQ